MIVGRFIITSVNAPAKREVCIPRNWQKNSIPTRPYIIEGMPDSVSAAYSIAAARRRLRAYSVRYIAAPTPRGRTITSEASTIYSVFSMSGRMPMLPER